MQDEEVWCYFFEEAKHWQELPPELQTIPEIRKAMSVLKMFSEKEKNYHLYQARQNALREERERDRLFTEQDNLMIQTAQQLQQALKEKEAERKQKEAAQQREAEERKQKEEERKQKEEALRQKEHLLELLKKAGIDPN